MTDQPAERQADQTRGANGKYTRDPATAERDAKAAQLRARGWSYRRIAAEMEYQSVASAYEAVQRALKAIVEEPATDVRQLELDRLDAMYEAVVKVLETKHLTVSQGRIIRQEIGIERDDAGLPVLDGEGKPIPIYEPLEDDAPVLAAVDRMLKIQERRARLLGLDAKTQHDMGIAEREVAIAEEQGARLAGVIGRVLDGLELTTEQQQLVAVVVPKELRAVAGGEG